MAKQLIPHPEFDGLSRAMVRLRDEGACSTMMAITYRFTAAKYGAAKDFCSGQGTFFFGSRWMAAGFTPTVYSSTTPELALGEALAQKRLMNIPDWNALPLIARSIRLELGSVLDLTNGSTRTRLRVSAARMTEIDWVNENYDGAEALPQAIGRAAWGAGIEALLVPSSVNQPGANLVVFPRNFSGSSFIDPM